MTAPMVAWMAYRGHSNDQNVEMAGSMIIPSIVAATLTWSGAIDSATGLAIQHAIMLPAMLGGDALALRRVRARASRLVRARHEEPRGGG